MMKKNPIARPESQIFRFIFRILWAIEMNCEPKHWNKLHRTNTNESIKTNGFCIEKAAYLFKQPAKFLSQGIVFRS